jgi:uncharacterized membrane protein YGL010W
MRAIADWLDSYSADHRNATNQLLHWICVPLIVWCVIALLWTVPVPPMLGRPGFWAAMAIVVSFSWYWKQSHRLAAALLLTFVLMGAISWQLFERLGAANLRWLALGVFVLAWIGQFVGHIFEGRRPSFFTDLAYLLIGPAWLMEKLLRRLGLGTAK